MQVSDADCKKIDDVLKTHPTEKKQIDDLRAKIRAMMPAGFGGANGGGRRNGGGDGAANGGGNNGAGNTGAARQRQPGDTTRRRGGNGGADQQSGGANGGGNGGGQRGNPEMRAINDQLRAPLRKDRRRQPHGRRVFASRTGRQTPARTPLVSVRRPPPAARSRRPTTKARTVRCVSVRGSSSSATARRRSSIRAS